MSRSALTLLCAAVCGLSACNKEEVNARNDSPTLIFGSFYGECRGEKCVEIYALDTRTKILSEDTINRYPSSEAPMIGAFAPLEDKYYQQVKDLPALFPEELLKETAPVIGAPDAADQGGYYVEVSHNGVRRYWLIDTNKSALPAYLRPFADTLRARLARLP